MSLRADILREPISALTLRPYAPVQQGLSVRQTVARMKDQQVGAAIVVDDAGRAVGMFTEKLLIRLLASRPEAMDEPVESHMANKLVCLRDDEPIARLLATMQAHKLRWVCITDAAGRPISLSGLRGVIEYVSEDLARLVKTQPIEPQITLKHREGA